MRVLVQTWIKILRLLVPKLWIAVHLHWRIFDSPHMYTFVGYQVWTSFRIDYWFGSSNKFWYLDIREFEICITITSYVLITICYLIIKDFVFLLLNRFYIIAYVSHNYRWYIVQNIHVFVFWLCLLRYLLFAFWTAIFTNDKKRIFA